MNVEIRKIQRVGNSSIVVTLPKEWAKRLGLSHGSQVLLVEEEDGIKVKPVEKKNIRGISLDLSRAPPFISTSIPVCFYLSGYEKAEIKTPSGINIDELRKRVLTFMGLHITEIDKDLIELHILLDMEKINIQGLIKTLGNIAIRITISARKLLEEQEASILTELEFLRKDFLRTLYVILRYLLSARYSSIEINKLNTLLSASYVGIAMNILYNTIIQSMAGFEIPEADKKPIIDIIKMLEENIGILINVIASPSIKRLSQLLANFETARAEIEEHLDQLKSARSGLILGRIQDTIEIIKLAAYVLICNALITKTF